MKIFHVVTELNYGGVERHVESIAKFIEPEFKENYFFISISKGGVTENKIRKLGFTVFVLNENPSFKNVKVILKIFMLILKYKPSVIHSHGSEANFHGLIAAFLGGVKIRIGEEIGIPSHSKLAKLVYKLIYFSSTNVIAISNGVKSWLINSGEVSVNKVITIYNPVEFLKLDFNFQKREIFTLCYAGRLEKVKNPIGLIEAFKKIVDKNVECRLLLLGDGSQREEIELLINKLNLNDFVRLFGFVDEPQKIISTCHLYIQPSLAEGFGIALVEAMGCGIPVIASPVGGAPEIIDNDKNGWISDSSSVDDLEKCILNVINMDSKQREKIGLNGKKSVINRFTTKIYMENLAKVYKND